MKRRAITVLVIVAIAGAGTLGWRAYEMRGDLDKTKAELDSLRGRLTAVVASGEGKEQELASVAADLKSVERELRAAKRELRDRQRCPAYPKLILSPSSGPPGTRVEFVGYCFVGSWGRVPTGRSGSIGGYWLFIMNSAQDLSDPNARSNGGPECELIAGTEPNALKVRPDGTATGYLTIPHSGACFQEDREEAVSPGEYHIGLECHTCSPLAIFRVTA